MKYYLIGKRMKEWYGFNSIMNFGCCENYDLSQKYFVDYFYEKYNTYKLRTDYENGTIDLEHIYIPNLITVEDYRVKNIYDMQFLRNEVIKVINTETKLSKDNLIKIDDKDYYINDIVYNTKLNRWEVYIDFILPRYKKVSKEYLHKCEENIKEVNKIIEEYDKAINELIEKHNKETQKYTQEENNISLLSKIKRLFKIK